MANAPDEDTNASPVARSFSLRGLNALVIGGSSGIGLAIAEGFLGQGARVALAGRTREKIDAALRRLQRESAFVRGYTADVSVDRELDTLLNSVLAEFGQIDILVPAQGITALKPAEEFTAADYDSIMTTNMRSVFFACTKVGRLMLARKQRLDRQYRLHGGSSRVAPLRDLLRQQTWRHRLDEDARGGMGRPRRARERDLARLFPD